MRRSARALGLMATACVVASCAQSNTERCDDGTICPDGTTCLPLAGADTRCVRPSALEACVGLEEGAPCTIESGAGTCTNGACIVSVCGDGIVDTNERCDDGNALADDGCSADCSSIETCGDGIVDLALGEQCDAGLSGLSGDGCTSSCRIEYNMWRDVTPPTPPRRKVYGLVTSSEGDGIALIGGLSGDVLLPGSLGRSSIFIFDDQWTWDSATWLQSSTPGGSPGKRAFPAIAHDPSRDRIVVFGGFIVGAGGALTYTNDLWEWDGVTWTQATPSLPWPPARAGASMACGAGQCMLFGGRDEGIGLTAGRSDLWSWNGTSWTQLQPNITPGGPTRRAGAAMVFDSAANRFVLIGGEVTGVGFGTWSKETWALDGTGAWQALPNVGLASARLISAAYDAMSNRTVAVAENEQSAFQLVGSTWTPIDPPPSGDTRIAYSPARQAIVALSGSSSVVANALVATSWVEEPPVEINASGLGRGNRTALAYDARRGRTVAVDDRTGDADHPGTWEWNGRGWRRVSTIGPPTGRQIAVAYDAACGEVVSFGGGASIATAFDATWRFNGTRWSEHLGPKPPPRVDHAMTYDAIRDELVMFGGETAAGPDNATWRYSGGCAARAWSNALPTAAPPARSGARLAFDARHGVAVLFGGSNGAQELADTWIWDGSSWDQRTPPSSPEARKDHAMSYDPRRGTVVLFGGVTGQTERQDTWEWNGTTWTELPTVVSPPARTGLTMAPDVTGALVYVGGLASLEQRTATWRLQLEQIAETREQCEANRDDDRDGLTGCADPDCWTRCAPMCPPGEMCEGPRCGDLTCQPGLETYLSCPDDCP